VECLNRGGFWLCSRDIKFNQGGLRRAIGFKQLLVERLSRAAHALESDLPDNSTF
jgi:hypothetical protein